MHSRNVSQSARMSGVLATMTSEARLFPPAFAAILPVVSLLAAVVAARVNGLDGPWLWNYEMPGFNYPWAVFFHEALQAGELPLWNDRLGLGFPLYAEGQIGAFYPVNWLLFQLPPLVALDATRVVHLVVLGVGTGLLALRLSGSQLAAVLAAPAIILSGGVVSKLEWTNLIQSFALVPWILIPLVRRPHPTRRGIALAGILWGLQTLPLHPNIWMLTGITAALIVLTNRPRPDSLLRLVALGLIAAGVGAIQIVPSALLWTQSVRLSGLTPGDLFRHTAMPFDLVGTAFANVFVKADLAGQDLNSTWLPTGAWGPLEGGSYIGLSAMVLAAAALRIRRARPLVAVSLFMILLPIVGGMRPSWWQALPIWNSLHAPVKGYMFLDLMIVLLAALGLARLRHRRLDIRAPAIVGGALVGGYLLLVVIVLLAPGLFLDLVTRFWSWTPPGGPQTVLQYATSALSTGWPVLLEIALGILVIVLLRTPFPPRRGLVVVAVLFPLALLSPSINRAVPLGWFDVSSSNVGEALAAIHPHRVLTTNGPTTWVGTPNRLAATGIPDVAMFSSLSLAATEALLTQLRQSDPDHLTARAAGIDTVASFGQPCAGEVLVVVDTVSLCHLDAAKAPYWVPSAVAQPSSTAPTFLQPVGATYYVDQAVVMAEPALVTEWTNTQGTIHVNAPEDGWLFIDRSWWPGWQVAIDGVDVRPVRALAGQLVPVPAGVHIIEQDLVLWDVGLGLAISIATLLFVTLGIRAQPAVTRFRRPRRDDIRDPKGHQAS